MNGKRRLPRTFAVDVGSLESGSHVRVCGWVTSVSGGFLHLQDSTGSVAVDLSGAPPRRQTDPRVGDAIDLRGTVAATNTVQAEAWSIHNRDSHGDDTRAEAWSPWSYLRFRDPQNVELFRSLNRAEQAARAFLLDKRFVELRVPLLWRGVQEYAEPEFRVSHPNMPSRGYSLLQSPMPPSLLACIGGLDRVFQFGRCIRWECTGTDPAKVTEFTHLNLTMTFMGRDDGKRLVETLLAHILRHSLRLEIEIPFPSVSYVEAIRRHGTDAPDYRHRSILTPPIPPAISGQAVGLQGILVPKLLPDRLATDLGALIGRHVGPDYGMTIAARDGAISLRGPLALDERVCKFVDSLGIHVPFTLLVLPNRGPSTRAVVEMLCSTLQQAVAPRAKQHLSFVWVDSPPFISDTDVHALFGSASAHSSRSLFGRRLPDETASSGDQKVAGFDLVLNGVEIMSGGEKEYSPERFLENLRLAGADRPETRYRYHVNALKRGAPPLCTAALGWERFLWKALDLPSIQDVIFLPKANTGKCPVAGLPEPLDP